MMQNRTHHSYLFNDFTIDLDRGCLLRGEQEVKLRPRVFEALRYLVENNNRLVTKTELMSAVWPNSFVTDDSLVQCLVELRRAFGDDAPGLIKTVPRRGYIFAANVEERDLTSQPVVYAEQVEQVTIVIHEEQPDREIEKRALTQGNKKNAAAISIQISTKVAVIALVLLIVAVVVVSVSYNRHPSLTDKDTVLIADFINSTGDDVFDGTLRHAMAVQLGQSPFINIFSEERIRETLRYMEHSPDERVTRDVAREIAQRQGIKAVIAGSISTLGTHYVINLEAVNALTGDTLSREQIEAESREQVLSKLGEAASKLRRELGESLSSIEQFDAPIEQVTTPSLDALKAFSLGREQHFSGKYFGAIPFYKRAVELDSNFAIAYAALAVIHGTAQEYDLAAKFSQKAFELRERTSEREKFYISARYYMDVLRDSDKTIEVQELWKQTYPRDFVPPTNLAVRYCAIGQFERAIEEAREGIRLNPDAGVGYASLALCFICLDRYDEAKATIEQALARKLEPPHYRYMLYSIAVLQGDAAAIQEQVDRAAGTPIEAGILAEESLTAAFSGELRNSRELTSRAIDTAIRHGFTEGASQYSAGGALREAAFGNCREAKETAARALAIARGRYALSWTALAVALCGDSNQAEMLADEMVRRFPQDTFVKTYWLPMIRAAVEISRNNSARAVDLLQPANGGEMGIEAALWPAYLRGLAFLRGRAGNEARVEFQKLIDHKGVLAPKDPNPDAYCLYPLAHLGLARAAAITGNIADSRKAYEDFFELWNGADADISVLSEAKREYQNLKLRTGPDSR
jgi:DNA-binding winged helix-turn-helix (wHTH) protein/tetratricopeptide (TPR) repeat protein